MCGVLLIILGAWQYWPVADPVVLRAGANQNPNFNFRGPDGKIQGFAVDVLNEAAQRAGYRLDWVFIDGQPDQALATQTVDVWPLLIAAESRRELIHMTAPWWRSAGGLLTRADRRLSNWAQLEGETVRLGPVERSGATTVKWPARVRIVSDPSLTDSLAHICAGRGRAVWSGESVLRALALERPPGCEGVRLAIAELPESAMPLAVGSSKDRAKEAEELYRQIQIIGRQGRTLELAARWNILPDTYWDAIDHVMHSYRRAIRLIYLISFVVLIALVLGGVAAWSRWRKMVTDRVAAARTLFLANMSHELRTPMNGVLGILDVVLGGDLQREQREQLVLAKSAASSLLTIVNDVLDFSQIDSGKIVLENILFSPREIAERSVRLVAGKAQAKNLELLYNVSPDVPKQVLGDPVRLQQVLLNLLGNAVKFTEKGHVRMVIRSEREGAQVRLHCTVSDTGIGIPRNKLKAVFESFTQADASTNRRYGGSGLGLAISSRLARQMNGTLRLDSEFGKGSEFTFDGLFGWIEIDDSAARQELAHSRAGLEILVADDNSLNQLVLRKLLERAGHHVLVVSDGAQALEAIQAKRYDLALFDIEMPGMGGLEAIEKLRHREQHNEARLPVIAVTGHALAGDRERFLKAGMDDCITKPIDAALLNATVARFVAAGA